MTKNKKTKQTAKDKQSNRKKHLESTHLQKHMLEKNSKITIQMKVEIKQNVHASEKKDNIQCYI